MNRMLKRLLILALTLCSALSVQAQEAQEVQDSLLTAMRREQRAVRGLTSYDNVFVPKGQWMVGATGSYSGHNNNNYSLVVVDGIESIGYNFEVSSMFAYAFSNNNAVGARISYDRNLLRVDSSTIAFGDGDSGVNLSMDDCYLLSHSYSVMAILRQYISIGENKRFALFNEIQLEGGGAQSKYTYDSPVQGTFSTTTKFAINFAPGITAFITNHLAAEINVGAMGFSYSNTKELQNQVTEGSYTTNYFNFKVNILSINFGIAYYL
ncbi:MAG: hypothetical protein SNI70_06260 [Rikenellaceae bacterium]